MQLLSRVGARADDPSMRGSGFRRSTRRRTSVMLIGIVVATVGLVAVGSGLTASAADQVWAQTLPGWDRSSSPSIADINGDGVPEIIFGSENGLLYVKRADGSDLPGWPQPVIVQGGRTAVDSSPAVGDLDSDGRPEIVVGAGSTLVPNQHGGLVAFHADGSVMYRFVGADEGSTWANVNVRDGFADGVFSSPAIGDVDGDGIPDVVFGGWDLRIHALNRFGRELGGFPFIHDDSTWGSPALYDIDNDGRLEIFIGGDSTPGGLEDWRGGVYRALDWRNGGVVELWKRRTAETFYSSSAIGDIDGDGRLETVVGSGDFYKNADSFKVWAFHLDDGSDVAGWPQSTGGFTFSSPVLGDLDGDGRPEVVVGSRDGFVWAWNGNGQLKWRHETDGKRFIQSNVINASPIIADVNGDGQNDVGIGNVFGYYTINGANGGLLQSWNFLSYESSGAVGDFGSAGGWRLVIIGFNSPQNNTEVRSLSIPPPRTTPPWPKWRKDIRGIAAPPSGGDPVPPGYCSRPSNPPGNPAPNSGRGYWVLRRDGSVTAFSAPQLGGFAERGVSGVQAVGMADTPDGEGYWLLAQNGRVLAYGTAQDFGNPSVPGFRAVAIARTSTGRGYWVLQSNGRVHPFGDAQYFGDPTSIRLNQPVIAMAPTRGDGGYWVLALDGGIFSYGNAAFWGSTGNLRLNAPVISMNSTRSGNGYWLLGRDGGMFAFGDAGFHGSAPGTGLCNYAPAVQLRRTGSGNGYWTLMSDNGVFSYGDASFFGAQPDGGANPPVDMVVRL